MSDFTPLKITPLEFRIIQVFIKFKLDHIEDYSIGVQNNNNTPDELITTVSVKADENGNWKAEDIDFKGKAYFDHAYEVKSVSSVDEAGNVADLSTPTTFYFPVPTAPEDHL